VVAESRPSREVAARPVHSPAGVDGGTAQIEVLHGRPGPTQTGHRPEEELLVQLGQVQAARVMKFTSAKEITAKAATIKAYVREAIAVEQAGLRVKRKTTADFPVPAELKERFRSDPIFKRAFEALTPGRQRSYLYHFAGAKQSATRSARIEKAMPAIFEGRGFLERR